MTFFCVLVTSYFSFASAITPQDKYKMYCMYTPKFKNLFQDYFLPSLKDDFELVVNECPQDCFSGNFRNEGWNKTMLNKLKLLQEAILENWNQVFFYSDIDIVFLKPILDISLEILGNNDFVVQQGWPKDRLCAGFFVMRGNEKTLQLIKNAYNLLNENLCVDDQVALQQVLDEFNPGAITWKFLPSKQFPNGRRVLKQTTGHYSKYSEIELNDSMVLFHASCCVGLENKYHFLRRVQKEFKNNHLTSD